LLLGAAPARRTSRAIAAQIARGLPAIIQSFLDH
jgi:hypothetical protein